MGEVLEINEKFQEIAEVFPKTRYFLITGGRGAAKTFFITWLCSRIMAERHNERILYTRYTMASANDSIVIDFKEMIERQNMGPLFVEKKNVRCCSPKAHKVVQNAFFVGLHFVFIQRPVPLRIQKPGIISPKLPLDVIPLGKCPFVSQ